MKLGFGYVTFLPGRWRSHYLSAFIILEPRRFGTEDKKKIESLRTEITSLKEKNTSEYNHIANSVNLDEVQQRAAELGMVYAEDSQIVKYQSAGDHKIRQYESIPEDGEATDKITA